MQTIKDSQLPPEDQRCLYSEFKIAKRTESVNGTEVEQEYTQLTLVLADKRMLETACKYGHQRPFLMDTTFAMVKYKGSFLTILVLDHSYKVIPVCWAFLPDEKANTIIIVLTAFLSALRKYRPEIAPSCFLTDDCDAEQKAVRIVRWVAANRNARCGLDCRT